jgi:hypothetical protein
MSYETRRLNTGVQAGKLRDMSMERGCNWRTHLYAIVRCRTCAVLKEGIIVLYLGREMVMSHSLRSQSRMLMKYQTIASLYVMCCYMTLQVIYCLSSFGSRLLYILKLTRLTILQCMATNVRPRVNINKRLKHSSVSSTANRMPSPQYQ